MTEKKPKLRPSVKKKWLAALRSGEYKQTTGEIRDENKPDSFCCLGVLCNIHAEEHPKFAKTQNDVASYDGANDVLSAKVVRWAFGASSDYLRDAAVPVKHPNSSDFSSINPTLASLNDSGYSFKKIANVIEKQL